VAITAPVPRPPRRFRCRATTAGWRSHATLGLCRSTTVLSGRVRRVTPFRRRSPPTFHGRRLPRARSPFTPAATLFGALRVSVFETRRDLSISATYFYDVRALRPELSESSQGRRPQPPSFSDARRGLPCGSGMRAASRTASVRLGLGAGCSHLRGFARPRCHSERATYDGLPRRSIVAIDVYGPLDRVKDVSPGASGCFYKPRVGCPCFVGASWRRSPPRRPESTHCRRCARPPRRRPRRA